MLTRHSRQIAATLALALFSVAPTLYVARTVRSVARPGHVREVEAEMSRRLGVLVRVGSVSHPRPDVDLLADVSLRLDDAGHAEIAQADSLRITHDGADLTVRARRLTIRGDAPSDAVGQAINLIRRLASEDVARINLVADVCEVRLGAGTETLTDLASIVQLDRSSPSLTASYLLKSGEKSARTRCELAIASEAGPSGGTTTVSLRTMDGKVPARVLRVFCDATGWLGASAELDGVLELSRHGAAHWESKFRGELTGVDLASVLGRRFAGHRLTGSATISIDAARWSERPGSQGPGWVEAKGTLTAGPGAISSGLLTSLASRMRFRVTEKLDEKRADVEFQGLGLAFAMNSNGELAIRGHMGGEYAPDAVLVQGQRAIPLARAPEGTANVLGLWNTLIPASPESLVPAVPEAHALRSLPLPPIAAGRLSAN